MTPQQSIGHYRIVSKLGEGGMGEVWRATDTRLGRDVAIKVLPAALRNDAQYMARFEREAQMLAALNHPNIAAIYGIEQGAIVMELVEGETLPCPVPLATALDYARQIADGLEAAHEKGIIHRDLKPANIRITPEGRVKILDFGLAKSAVDPAAATAVSNTISPTLSLAMTQAGMILGTAAYMAPEQARGKPVDKRADIWAFGVVLYEMLTGRSLFGGGETVADTLASVVKDAPDLKALPADVPPHIRRLIERCLRKEPSKRLRDIGEARIAIEEPVEAPPAAAAPANARRWWLPWAIAATLAVAAATLGAMLWRESAPAPAVRFQVLPPEGGSFAQPWMAVSPDGRKIVFQATGKGISRPLLWVRSFDALEARPLPGTENAFFPFWSPDSRSIGFWANAQLSRVEASGGLPQVLCSTAKLYSGGNSAGWWGPDGTIYFSGGGRGIFRVSQNGGEPAHILKPDHDRGERSYFYPVLLPDGKRLLYHGQFATREEAAIVLSSLDGKEKTRLASSMFSFGYAPPARRGEPAHLLYVRQATLIAQPVDPSTLVSAGEVVPLADLVAAANTYARFAVSPSGILAYRAGEAFASRELTWFDRSGKALSTVGVPADYQHVALSPDNSKLAATQSDIAAGRRDLWVFDLARGVPTRFTFERADNNTGIWSPDGARLAFASRSVGPFSLYMKNANGSGGEDLVAEPQATVFPMDWSSDGRLLMYMRQARGSGQLWVITDPADPARRKDEPYLETTYYTGQAKFAPSPAGTPPRWVAYVSDESRGSEVFVQSFPPGGGKFQISSGGGIQPRWRRDGKELFYISADGKLMAVDVQAGATFQAGVPRALFDTRIVENTPVSYRYDVTADGSRFLVNSLRQADVSAPVQAIVVVMNWQSGLRK
jgi:Tol biopolymer transport system component/predicted Ser/Thr protein kinase